MPYLSPVSARTHTPLQSSETGGERETGLLSQRKTEGGRERERLAEPEKGRKE